MNDKEILIRLKEITRNVLGRNEIVLDNRTKFKDLGLNSFGLVQLICAIEEEFEIEIPNLAIRTVNSVPSAVRYIKKCLKEKAQKNVK